MLLFIVGRESYNNVHEYTKDAIDTLVCLVETYHHITSSLQVGYSSCYGLMGLIDFSHIGLIIAIWPGDRIRRPEHSTVEHGSCDESV